MGSEKNTLPGKILIVKRNLHCPFRPFWLKHSSLLTRLLPTRDLTVPMYELSKLFLRQGVPVNLDAAKFSLFFPNLPFWLEIFQVGESAFGEN